MATDKLAAATAIDAFLRAIGRDATQEPDLVGTGARVTDAFIRDLCAGYAVDTHALLESNVLAAESPGVVVVRDVPISTTCPHHLIPSIGHATIAMQTKHRLVGLGTLAALLDAHSRRLTLQERIGERVCADIEEVVAPEWVACRIVLTHGCMITRGERAHGASVETIATRGDVGAKKLASIYAALGVGAR
jgi:GTP cyclohydrolase I